MEHIEQLTSIHLKLSCVKICRNENNVGQYITNSAVQRDHGARIFNSNSSFFFISLSTLCLSVQNKYKYLFITKWRNTSANQIHINYIEIPH